MLSTTFEWSPARIRRPGHGPQALPGTFPGVVRFGGGVADRTGLTVGVAPVRHAARDVAVTAVIALSAFAVVEAAMPAGASHAAYATGSAAIAIAILWTGSWTGLLATAMTAAVAAFLYLDPVGSLAVADPDDRIGLALFAINGLTLTVVCGWLRSRSSHGRSRGDTPSMSTASAVATSKPVGRRRGSRPSGAHRMPAITVLDGQLIERLTARELEVLELLAGGLSNTEMADALVVSMNTVKSHLKSIYGKLAVISRTQAVVRAGELGLLEPNRAISRPAARSGDARPDDRRESPGRVGTLRRHQPAIASRWA